MPSEVLSVKPLTIETNPNEAKNVLTSSSLSSSAAAFESAPISTGPNAIISVIPINTDYYGPYGKPNAIVRPVRRNEHDEMILPENANEANFSTSRQPTPKVNVPEKYKKREIDTLTKKLDNKLCHSQKDKRAPTKNVKLKYSIGFPCWFYF